MADNSSKTGGPAFPGEQGHTLDGTWNQTWEPGMTLRDYFAGQALAGLCSSDISVGDASQTVCEVQADIAYAMADAMIEARDA